MGLFDIFANMSANQFGSAINQTIHNTENKTEKIVFNLSSVRISQNHMCYTYCYSFYAWRDSDSCFLNAKCILNNGNDYQEVDFEGVKITDSEFNQFVELDKKYDFLSNIKIESREKEKFFACDETITCFSVKYGDKLFNLNTQSECFSEVHGYFLKLAEKYSTQS